MKFLKLRKFSLIFLYPKSQKIIEQQVNNYKFSGS